MIETLIRKLLPELEMIPSNGNLRSLFEREPAKETVTMVAPSGEDQVASLLEAASSEGFKVLTYHGLPLPPEAAEAPAALLSFRNMKGFGRFDVPNLSAIMDRGVTYAEATGRSVGTETKIAYPLVTRNPEVLASAGARDVPMCACRFHETAVGVMTVVLADGRKMQTGAHALSEACVCWTGEGGPYVSQWFNGARDALGIVVSGSIFLYPVHAGRRVFCHRFTEMERALEALKEISRRQVAWEAFILDGSVFSGLEGKAREPGFYLLVGIDVFEELAAHFEKKAGQICAANQGRAATPPPITFLDTAHRPTSEPVLPFYTQFQTLPEHLEEVRQACSETKVKEPSLCVISNSRGRSVVAYLVFDEDLAEPDTFLEELMDRLYDKGALFDVLPYRLQKKLLKKNEALWTQLIRVKKLLDPKNTLNPHEIPLE